MNWIFKIAPRQLKDIDTYLRENIPWVWATRIHFTLYLSILLGLVSVLVGIITPVNIENPLSQREIMEFYSIMMVPTVIFMGYVIFNLVLFNVEKRKGRNSYFRPIAVFPMIMLSFLLPLTMPYSVVYVLNTKVKNLEETEQVIKDEFDLYKAEYFVNSGTGDYRYFESHADFERDLVGLYKDRWSTNYNYDEYNDTYDNMMRDSLYWHKGIFEKSRSRLYRNKNHPYDNISDEILRKVNSQYMSHLDSTLYMFYKQQNCELSMDTAKTYLNKLNGLVTKYSYKSPISVDSTLFDLKNNNYVGYQNRILKEGTPVDYSYEYRYGWEYGEYGYHDGYRWEHKVSEAFDKARASITKIGNAKFKLIPRDASKSFIGFLFVAFAVASLLFLFRHVSWKQFLLSLLILGLYATISAMIEFIGNHRGHFFPAAGLLLILGSIIMMNRVWGVRKFSFITNQFAIIATLALPWLGMMVLGYLDEVHDFWEWPYFDKYKIWHETEEGHRYLDYGPEWRTLQKDTYLYTFWSGIFFFWLIALPYLKKIFVRLMSLPTKS